MDTVYVHMSACIKYTEEGYHKAKSIKYSVFHPVVDVFLHVVDVFLPGHH